MAENRIPRAAQTREADARPMAWRPPELLPNPNPEEGFTFRWVRMSTMGKDDPMNLSTKLREGYVPVKASDHPELHIASSNGQIEFGGLVLCKIPSEIVRQRGAYYNGQTRQQMESVDNNFMRENDPRMPLFKERKSNVTFGSGS